mgnify:FL=1
MKCIGEENLKARFCGWIRFISRRFRRFIQIFFRFFNRIFVIPQESLQKFCEIYNLDSFGMTKFMIQNKTKNYGGKFQILLSKM